MKKLAAYLPAILIGLLAASAHATIEQQIFFGFDPTPDDRFNGDEIEGGDSIRGDTDADIDRALVAGIAGGGFQANGSVGELGNYGLSGFLSSMGELHAQVFIAADVVAPPSGPPRAAEANFIIDGGLFDFIAGPASTLTYNLTLSVDFGIVFQAFGEIQGDPMLASPTFRTLGDDIGATQDPTQPSRVEIPFSFQSVDLGILNPGQSFRFEYQLDIVATVPDVAEGIFFQFQDPLGIPDLPFRPEIAFGTPPPIPMTEPSALFLMLAGLFALAMIRR